MALSCIYPGFWLLTSLPGQSRLNPDAGGFLHACHSNNGFVLSYYIGLHNAKLSAAAACLFLFNKKAMASDALFPKDWDILKCL